MAKADRQSKRPTPVQQRCLFLSSVEARLPILAVPVHVPRRGRYAERDLPVGLWVLKVIVDVCCHRECGEVLLRQSCGADCG